MRINVRFDNTHGRSKEYCYNAPKGTRVGDVVRVPPNYWNSESKLATVTSIPRPGTGYTGPTKWVEVVFHKAQDVASGPNYEQMLEDLEAEAKAIAQRGLEIQSQLNFIRERV